MHRPNSEVDVPTAVKGFPKTPLTPGVMTSSYVAYNLQMTNQSTFPKHKMIIKHYPRDNYITTKLFHFCLVKILGPCSHLLQATERSNG